MAFETFDLNAFWEDSAYARKNYTEPAPSADIIAAVERELGVTLPASYIAFAKRHNGGMPRLTAFPMQERTSWAVDHVAVTGIYAIGRNKPCSLCGELGSAFWQSEWGYPDIGIYFADCPSAGHDMFALDYRKPGPSGEPTVVHVDQEADYRITHVAPSFEAFILGLRSEFDFE